MVVRRTRCRWSPRRGWPKVSARRQNRAATWLGHATVLLEIDGRWVLTDPVWSERVSPVAKVGPKRNHPVPVPLDALPQLDAVLISHDHYDHLDTATIDRLTREQEMPFVVPLGVGAHLRSWGVPQERIIELDWDQTHTIGDLRLTCTEARHIFGPIVRPEHHTVVVVGDRGWRPADLLRW